MTFQNILFDKDKTAQVLLRYMIAPTASILRNGERLFPAGLVAGKGTPHLQQDIDDEHFRPLSVLRQYSF